MAGELPWRGFLEAGDGAEEPQWSAAVRTGDEPLPFFAEYPYFLWGEVNYDSDGDCGRPTDRGWSDLYLENRDSGSRVSLEKADSLHGFSVTGGVAKDVAAAAYLTALRSGGSVIGQGDTEMPLDEIAKALPEKEQRLREADELRAMFLDPILAPFDTHGWWGGWKWCGTFATDFALGLRLTMRAVQTGEADPDLTQWLLDYWRQPVPEWHREGVRCALTVLTGVDPERAE